jgi:hypothetical protein
MDKAMAMKDLHDQSTSFKISQNALKKKGKWSHSTGDIGGSRVKQKVRKTDSLNASNPR